MYRFVLDTDGTFSSEPLGLLEVFFELISSQIVTGFDTLYVRLAFHFLFEFDEKKYRVNRASRVLM